MVIQELIFNAYLLNTGPGKNSSTNLILDVVLGGGIPLFFIIIVLVIVCFVFVCRKHCNIPITKQPETMQRIDSI